MKQLVQAFVWLFLLLIVIAGCADYHEETIAGVQVPIPNGMRKTQDQGAALSLPGFGAGQASFQGNVDPDKVIEFYKKEMPARAWKPNFGLVSRGGMLAYSKDTNSVLLSVAKQDKGTILTVTVGKTEK
jgi:hypothetical protein